MKTRLRAFTSLFTLRIRLNPAKLSGIGVSASTRAANSAPCLRSSKNRLSQKLDGRFAPNSSALRIKRIDLQHHAAITGAERK